MLHLRVKLRSYFSVSIKPLGEPPKSPFAFTYVKNYSHLGLGSWPQNQQVLACVGTVRANTEGLFTSWLTAAFWLPLHLSVVKANQEKAMQVSGNLLPSMRKMLCQFKFHSVRKTEGFKASVTIIIL